MGALDLGKHLARDVAGDHRGYSGSLNVDETTYCSANSPSLTCQVLVGSCGEQSRARLELVALVAPSRWHDPCPRTLLFSAAIDGDELRYDTILPISISSFVLLST